ncbi:TMhelix containing protein [Vibrio phage 1.193.O._10N.286.52.C6]|nr:TMhelix containing protein [Vibrio phage 1.193.O._10N.286.52.C6]
MDILIHIYHFFSGNPLGYLTYTVMGFVGCQLISREVTNFKLNNLDAIIFSLFLGIFIPTGYLLFCVIRFLVKGDGLRGWLSKGCGKR